MDRSSPLFDSVEKVKAKSKYGLTTKTQRNKRKDGDWPDKQARTGHMTSKDYDELPVLQVEQVNRGCFEAIYEDNVWKMKPNSNDQIGNSVIEFLFVS